MLYPPKHTLESGTNGSQKEQDLMKTEETALFKLNGFLLSLAT